MQTFLGINTHKSAQIWSPFYLIVLALLSLVAFSGACSKGQATGLDSGAPASSAKLPLIIQEPSENETVQVETITVRGQTLPDAIVVVNEHDVDVRSDGTWSILIKLIPGRNLIIAAAVDFEGNESVAARDVRYIPATPPASTKLLLILEQPAENTIFRQPTVLIKGRTIPKASVDINEKPALVESDGAFTSSLELRPGLNAVVVNATDQNGNEGHIVRYVTFRP